MGLGITIGVLKAFEGQEEILRGLRKSFSWANGGLRTAGLPPHEEPEDLNHDSCLSFGMVGYRGILLLRRYAAYLWDAQKVAPHRTREPGPADDPVLRGYLATCDWQVGAGGARLFRSPPGHGPSFDHLVFHGEDHGLYLPVRCDEVLLLATVGGTLTDSVGSSFALKKECRLLAMALEIPEGMDPESEELHAVAEEPEDRGPPWRRFGMEALTCVQLLAAARRSIETRAAVVFH
jgi:hypothetical protein